MNNKDMPACPVFCTNSDQQLYGLTKLESHEKEASLLLAEALEAFKEVAAIFNRVEEAALAELERRNQQTEGDRS